MPKKIERIREQLLSEARLQIKENGYSSVTVRSVAGACNLGIGTVYNYFESKDALIATFLLEDWGLCLEKMRECQGSGEERIEGVYNCLVAFIRENAKIFKDGEAKKSFSSGFFTWHKRLRVQLSKTVSSALDIKEDSFEAEFIAEALLSWSAEDEEFSRLKEIILKIIK